MAKVKKAWFCSNCGNESPKWMGKCPACGEWNTMVEEIISKEPTRNYSVKNKGLLSNNNSSPQPLTNIQSQDECRIALSSGELDRVLGGGLVKGSIVLIAGEPGIGKSTLSLQIPLANHNIKTLYVSGEESARQIKLRADRLGGAHDNCLVYPETLLENILDHATDILPDILVVDSIQTIYSQNIDSSAGSM